MQHLIDSSKKISDIIVLGDRMKRKQAIGIGCLIIILVLISGILIIKHNRNKELKEQEKIIATSKFEIIYTYGGGFGTIAHTVTKEVTIDQDGNITFRVPSYEDIEPVKYKMSKSQAKALYSILISRGFMNLPEDLSQNDVTDAGSSFIEIKSDNFERKIGGYAAFINKKYSRLTQEIIKDVGQKRISDFNEIVIQKLEKSDC